jgi:hypothetical protein
VQQKKNSREIVEPRRMKENGIVFLLCFYLLLRWYKNIEVFRGLLEKVLLINFFNFNLDKVLRELLEMFLEIRQF